MLITEIQSFLLSVPYATAGGYHFIAGRPASALNMLLVRVRTDDGVEGWGEAFGHSVAPATKVALDTLVAPLFIGRDPTDIASLTREVAHKIHIFGRNGPAVFALSGIDIALWDIAGTVAQRPLYQLLGGTACSAVPAYASLLRGSNPQAVGESCAQAREEGYAHVKLHEVTLPAIAAARDALGPDVALMVDTNCPWTVDEAVDMAQRLVSLDLYWLEEPVWPPEDFAGLARVRGAGAITAAGENVAGIHSFRQLLAAGAVDVVQPSVSKVGGITAMREVITAAQEAGVRIVPHCGYMGAGYLASLHVVAALQEEQLMERLAIGLADSPYGDWTNTSGGRAAVPQGPGLGCDPDMRVVERFLVH